MFPHPALAVKGLTLLIKEMALSPPIIRRLLIRPDNKEKVELFGPDKSLYGFRWWQYKRKDWRRAAESIAFESYALAVFEAARQIDWIEHALAGRAIGAAAITWSSYEG
jgi:hypothetical protein